MKHKRTIKFRDDYIPLGSNFKKVGSYLMSLREITPYHVSLKDDSNDPIERWNDTFIQRIDDLTIPPRPLIMSTGFTFIKYGFKNKKLRLRDLFQRKERKNSEEKTLTVYSVDITVPKVDKMIPLVQFPQFRGSLEQNLTLSNIANLNLDNYKFRDRDDIIIKTKIEIEKNKKIDVLARVLQVVWIGDFQMFYPLVYKTGSTYKYVLLSYTSDERVPLEKSIFYLNTEISVERKNIDELQKQGSEHLNFFR